MWKVEVMKHIKVTEDMGVKKLNDELKEKIEDLEDMEQLNQDLIVKERKSHDELQEAHKEQVTAPPCPDHAIEAREAERDDDEDEDLHIHDD
ncbi:hypothetical protein Taro_008900 [Colocasia esculenta]|uniref:Uncharacterized protein n=1 Tax=Colocasia esculenta TaxID=4460 RepID=A0A843TYU9_COLES|nr:hypothetical protein [Colocasia esculenta]